LSFPVDLEWSKIDVVLPQYKGLSADSRDLDQKLSIGAKF
jgi:hypothetical protein